MYVYKYKAQSPKAVLWSLEIKNQHAKQPNVKYDKCGTQIAIKQIAHICQFKGCGGAIG